MAGHETQVMPALQDILVAEAEKTGPFAKARELVPMIRKATDQEIRDNRALRIHVALRIYDRARTEEKPDLETYAIEVAQGGRPIEYHNAEKKLNIYIDGGLRQCHDGRLDPRVFFENVALGKARIKTRYSLP